MSRMPVIKAESFWDYVERIRNAAKNPSLYKEKLARVLKDINVARNARPPLLDKNQHGVLVGLIAKVTAKLQAGETVNDWFIDKYASRYRRVAAAASLQAVRRVVHRPIRRVRRF